MSKELVIASNRHETRVAILEDDQLVEVYFQRSNEYSLAGSIHKGRVTRVLPGMQSAFVDLGLERDTFLYVSDFFEENEDIDTVSEDRGPRRERSDRRGDRQGDRGNQPERGANEGRRERPDPVAMAPRIQDAPVVEALESISGSEESFTPAVELAASGETERSVENTSTPYRQEGRSDSGDRGRGGDRRGRRSRRRRPRGQGFPENKYAQPGSVEGESSTAAVEAETEEAEDTAPIILPGESLAKYRHSAPAPFESAREPIELHEAEEDYADVEPVDASEAEEIAAIHERAEELQAADLILSHSSADEPAAVEEAKLEDVRHDDAHDEEAHEAEFHSHQAVSPFVVGDIEVEEEESAHLEAEVREGAPVEALHLERPDLVEEEAATEPDGLGAAERAEDRFETHGSAVEADEPYVPYSGSYSRPTAFEVRTADVEEAERLVAELELEPLEAGEFDGADLEDAQATEGGVGEAGGAAEGGEPESRSASVREQGGRSMHRVSRRMRRRRGGNRFGQPPQAHGQPAREDGSTFEATSGVGGAATGAAPAQAESRREAEPRAERGERPERVMPSITDLLKPGQELIVQIAKEPLGQKGARITSHVALPGRYVVFMPSVNHLGVSRKVESDEERQRLKRILQAHRVGTTGGFIVRTAGEGVPEEEIAADMDFLYKLWLDIRQKAEKKPAPLLLHYDLDVVQRILRDQVTEDYKAIWVDNELMYESILSFVQRFQPTLVGRVKMYTREAPIFDAFGITQELEKALRPKVWLKSGGYIVINQTEALVAIDINTGKYVGKSNRLEDTIVKTNLEAVKEIVRQIRLRDLGGIIVVDFIDMDERKNRQKVMQALEEAMQTDKAPYKILQFNDFGLVAITRKRVKQSLERTLCAPCPYCEGAGYVKSVQTIISEILVEAQKIRKALDRNDVLLRVHPDVAKILKANDNRYLEELEEMLGLPVLVKGDPALHHEKFDLG